MPHQPPPDTPPPAHPDPARPETPAGRAASADPSIRAEVEARARRRAAARRKAAPPPGAPLPARPRFSQPVRQILMMLIVLGLVGAGGAWAYGRIWDIFAASPWLNGVIGAVFVLGVLTCFWQVGQLVRSVSWIERFANHRRTDSTPGHATPGHGPTESNAPLLLAPLAALLGGRREGGAISATAARSMLDSVATRIDEARDITRYLANLLIFLGLLGTFYGLATTVPAVVETIRALAPQEGETAMQVFDKLMSGLEGQLGGMATAFSSSLLGLAGSLVVGLLELFVTHGQNRFYRELEEWMTSFTSIAIADAEAGEQDVLAGFADRIAGHFDRLAHFYAERDRLAELDQLAADERALLMARTVDDLARHVMAEATARHQRIDTDRQTALRLVEGQDRLIAQGAGAQTATAELSDHLARLVAGQNHLTRLAEERAERQARPDPVAERMAEGQERLIALAEIGAEDRAAAIADLGNLADEVRARLRSLDSRLARLAENTAEGRLAMQAELRSDLSLLTRAVRRIGSAQPQHDGTPGAGDD